MGALWDIIQVELDRERFHVSDRELAELLHVSRSLPGNWRKGVKRLPLRSSLEAIAGFTNYTYEDVLLIALSETGHARGTRLERHRAPPVESRADAFRQRDPSRGATPSRRSPRARREKDPDPQ